MSPAAETLLLKNGRFWTGDPHRPWAEAVLVEGERIRALGSLEEVRQSATGRARETDLEGALGLPGFIDSHVHFMAGGFQLLSVNLRSAQSPQEMARRLGERAATIPAGTWITGGEWDHENWGGELPRRDQVDGATPNHPVFVRRLDGHMALANSLALRLASIDRTVSDPPGGTVVRDRASGEPTGVLKDKAMDLVARVIPGPDDAKKRAAALAALSEAARLGVTSVHDMGSFEDLRLYQSLKREGRLILRIYSILPLPEWENLARAGLEATFGDSWISVGAVKGFVDGSLGSTTALFYEPYADAPETSGLPADMMFPEGNLRRLISAADGARLRLAVHAIGDRANGILLDLVEELVADGGRERRFRIEHAQHLRPEHIDRMARLGVVASMQPYHAVDDGRWAEKRLGAERIRLAFAFRSLLDRGVKLAFGSDWFVAPLNPLLGIDAAVTRRTLDGKHPNGWIPEQKISLEEALRAYTGGGAYASFEEDRKGVLRPGALADIVVLSEDLFRLPPERIREARVTRTWVGGRRVFPPEG